MIYLIGGPPKCGKTTLAKELSKSLGIPWVSTDTLQNVIKPYLDKKDFSKNFPTSNQSEKDNDGKYSKYSSDEIIGFARHSKTLKELVIYKALYSSEEFGNNALWARPKSMFLETVNIDGKEIPRFKFIG